MPTPTIKPIKVKEFEVKQSKYDQVPKLSLRSMIVGPSGSGKTILLQNMILDVYRDCFSRIYIWSPSIDIDHTWKPVKEYIEREIKPDRDEKYLFDSYDPSELRQVIETQYNVIYYMKQQKYKTLYQILILVDGLPTPPSSRGIVSSSISFTSEVTASPSAPSRAPKCSRPSRRSSDRTSPSSCYTA